MYPRYPVGSNALLAAMVPAERERIQPHLTPRPLPFGDVLYEVDAAMSDVYFPTSGIISTVVVMEEGGTIEGVLSGREGAFGIAAAFGDMRSPWLVTVQLPGEALAIPAQKLATLLPQLPHFERLLFRYEHALQQMAMHAMACNRFHPINERLARWLLMTQDRDGEELLTTQEYLARMLGVHRPGVTVALGALEQAGLVRRAGRGRIEVLDRAALEAASCECYRRVVDAIARVFE